MNLVGLFIFFLQYVYLRQMTKAAVVIQNQFRSYYEHKRFKKNLESPMGGSSSSNSSSSSSNSSSSSSNNSSSSSSSNCGMALASVPNYRNYREGSMSSSGRQSREGTPTSSALKYGTCTGCTYAIATRNLHTNDLLSQWLIIELARPVIRWCPLRRVNHPLAQYLRASVLLFIIDWVSCAELVIEPII